MGAERVEIPAYTDRWMMGDRCGVVLATYDKELPSAFGLRLERVARVRLDKSGKVVRVIYTDCRHL